MSMPHPLRHLDQYGADKLDSTTLRLLRDAAVAANEADERIREQMDANMAKVEWDPVFARDSVERHMAIATIDAELAKRAPSPEAANEAADLLAWLDKNPSLDLAWGEIDNDMSDCRWRVHRSNGSINDREWKLIAIGDTALAALRAAKYLDDNGGI